MTHGQIRSISHERNSTHQQTPPSWSLKDICCDDYRAHDTPARSSEFAPTGNRFSILTELGQPLYQTKWASDFVRSPNSAARRRGKRGGGGTKLRFERQQQQRERKSDSGNIEELRTKMASPRLDGEAPRNNSRQRPKPAEAKFPQSDFVFSTDSTSSQWMPQFQPTSQNASTSLPTKPPNSSNLEKVAFARPINQCLAQERASLHPVDHIMTEFKRKESRFFPLSAFLTTPDTSTNHPAQQTPTAPTPAKTGTARKQLSVTIPTSAQKAAASAACRTLGNQIISSPPSTVTVGVESSIEASSLPLATSIPVTPFLAPTIKLESLKPISQPYSPFVPYTPALKASPTLTTTSTAVSATPPLSPAPSITSTESSPISKAVMTPPLPSLVRSWTPVTAPEISSSTFSLPPVTPSIVESPKSPDLLPKPILTTKLLALPKLSKTTVPILTEPTTTAPMSSVVQKELENFLKMGHANSCWCEAHNTPAYSVPLSSVQVRPATSTQEHVVLRKVSYSDSNVESVFPTMSPLGSEFEDLGEMQGDEEFDEEWTVIAPDEQYEKQQCHILSTNEIDSTMMGLVALKALMSSRSHTPTARTSSRSHSPIHNISPAMAASHSTQEPSKMPIQQPLSVQILDPEPTNPWTICTRSNPEAERDKGDDENRYEGTVANTSAVGWSMLREAVEAKWARREKRGAASEAERANV